MAFSLPQPLCEIGVTEDEQNARNKVSRGKFTAAILLQCFKTMGVQELRVDRV